MVKQEIKNFTLDIGSYTGLECTAPCSKYSVLLQHGFIGDVSCEKKLFDAGVYAKLGCCFTSELDVSPLMMSMKSVYLRFDGLDTACRVELNGKEIAVTNSAHRPYSFDVKTKISVGKNVLKLYFTPTEQSKGARGITSSFGTKTSPYLPDCGIFRGVSLVGFNHKMISGINVKQYHEDGRVRLHLTLNTIGYDDMSRAVATLTAPAGDAYFCGFMNGEGSMIIDKPNIWWPNGMGAQSLYRLNVNLYSDSQIEDTYEMRIGLRTVGLITDEDGEKALAINGVPMFSMGAKYRVEDALLSRVTPERTRELLAAAKSANMNAIYVDKTVYYADERFLSDCDELGLLVWQEIPTVFSNDEYSEAALTEIKQEMSENLTRMAYHPSLGVIIGSPEIESALSDSAERARLVGRFSNFDGMNVFDSDGSLASKINVISFDSIPTQKSISKFIEDGEENIGSETFELHGASFDRVGEMLNLAYKRYPYANGISELSYVLGMSSAENSRLAAEEARKTGKGRFGIFAESLNDTWPAVSPSGIDYFGEKKPLHYFERRFFSPVSVIVTESNNRVKFTVSNANQKDFEGVFSYAIINNKNKPEFRDSFPIKARASENMEIQSVDFGSVMRGHEREYYLYYSVTNNSDVPFRGVYLFTPEKRFEFLKPTFTVDIVGNLTEFTVAVGADCFVKGLEICFPDTDAELENNYIDITGKAPVRLKIKTKRPITAEKLKRVMQIRSAYNLGREKKQEDKNEKNHRRI